RDRVIIVGGASSTDLITMADGSILEDLTVNQTGNSPSNFRGIVFPGTSLSGGAAHGVSVTVINNGAGNAIGIQCNGTGGAIAGFQNVTDTLITLGANGGIARGILVDTSAQTLRIRDIVIVDTVGSSSGIGIEVNAAGALIFADN